MKVGDKLTIHCYKHNGKIDRISGEAIVLDETDEYLVCANNKVKLIESFSFQYKPTAKPCKAQKIPT